MIIGLGTDLCDSTRIAKTLETYGERFINKLYTKSEQQAVERRPHKRAAGYALRFAAKEACAKALGTGFRKGVYWIDIELSNDELGKPELTLTNGAYARMLELTPPNMKPQINITLTDEDPTAQAIVIISAVPA
ncbi:MAG: holo-ACP synthase [Rhodospirillales bacterium]|jgi:holo-[acyl-carrier protein] synthase|nr:holo-ACP synthase [Rhodospirillales bacterium]